MQVDSTPETAAPAPATPAPVETPRVETPRAETPASVETPTVTAATEQLQELIASLQRTSKQSDTIVSTLTPEVGTIISLFSYFIWMLTLRLVSTFVTHLLFWLS